LQALDLKRLIDDLDRLTVTGQLLVDDLDGAVTQADLPGLSAEMKATSTALRGVVQGKPTQEMLAAVRDAAQRLPKLLDQLQQTAARSDDGLADLQQRLAPLLRDAAVIAANLRQTSETARRDPASLLLGAPPPPDRQQ
jgi:hypothetical protein